MKTLDWDELRIFLNVARAQSLRAAAERTPNNQSTLSRRLMNLEHELGVTLFHRSARGINITPAGESLVQLAAEIEGRVRLIEAKIADQKQLAGMIRLWVSEGIGGYWLPPRMKEFHRRHPGITVEVLCSIEPPATGIKDIDVALSWHKPTQPDTMLLSSNKMVLKPFASAEYLQLYGTPRNLEDLKHHRLCDHLLYPKDGEWKRWAKIVEESRNVTYRTNSSWALGEATKSGIGISLQPVGVQHRESGLRMLEVDGYAPTLKFWLTSQKFTRNVPRIRALIDYIKSELFMNPVAGSAFLSDQ